MVQTLKKMISDQIAAFAADGVDEVESADSWDMLERGESFVYNPKLFSASQKLTSR